MNGPTLDGKAAIVTGASRGIGAAVAERLTLAGAFVIGLARTARERKAAEGWMLRCDVTDVERVEEVVTEVLAAGHAPDILVNNAGMFLMRDLVSTSTAEFARQLDVNLVAPFSLLRSFLPHLAERRGHIVTIGSVVDYQVFPGNAAYAAAKHGLRALHDIMRLEWAGRIKTTLVSPGPTDTTAWDPVDPDTRSDLPDRADMLRPDDVADAVLYAVTRPKHASIDVMRISPSGLS